MQNEENFDQCNRKLRQKRKNRMQYVYVDLFYEV